MIQYPLFQCYGCKLTDLPIETNHGRPVRYCFCPGGANRLGRVRQGTGVVSSLIGHGW